MQGETKKQPFLFFFRFAQWILKDAVCQIWTQLCSQSPCAAAFLLATPHVQLATHDDIQAQNTYRSGYPLQSTRPDLVSDRGTFSYAIQRAPLFSCEVDSSSRMQQDVVDPVAVAVPLSGRFSGFNGGVVVVAVVPTPRHVAPILKDTRVVQYSIHCWIQV